jgi:hypothetical protein
MARWFAVFLDDGVELVFEALELVGQGGQPFVQGLSRPFVGVDRFVEFRQQVGKPGVDGVGAAGELFGHRGELFGGVVDVDDQVVDVIAVGRDDLSEVFRQGFEVGEGVLELAAALAVEGFAQFVDELLQLRRRVRHFGAHLLQRRGLFLPGDRAAAGQILPGTAGNDVDVFAPQQRLLGQHHHRIGGDFGVLVDKERDDHFGAREGDVFDIADLHTLHLHLGVLFQAAGVFDDRFDFVALFAEALEFVDLGTEQKEQDQSDGDEEADLRFRFHG